MMQTKTGRFESLPFGGWVGEREDEKHSIKYTDWKGAWRFISGPGLLEEKLAYKSG